MSIKSLFLWYILQEGNTPAELAPLTLTPEAPNAPPKKVVKMNPTATATETSLPAVEASESSMEQETGPEQIPLKVPVVEQMQVCLIRFGSWTPTVIHPVTFQSNCVMFSFNGKFVSVAGVIFFVKTFFVFSIKDVN